MKVRNGFVSNSSSSSFVIYGVCLDTDSPEIQALMEKHLTEDEIESVKDGDEMLSEFLYGKYDRKVLEVHEDYECECIYIGRSWSSIGDDETGKEFKESIKTKIEEFVGSNVSPRTIDAEIHN